ncbi:MAG: DMT family transporter [Pyrinomonadaceae bacterium]|nr:DMT family transporter [Pyrinomonadaceae bacterium]
MKVAAVWILLCLIWGTTWIFIKLGLDEGLPPISFAAARFIVAVLILGVVVFSAGFGLPKTRREWIIILIAGLCQFSINYGLLFWGEQHISSGLAAVLQATIPAFGLTLAPFMVKDERFTLFKFAAVLVGIGGVAVVFAEQLQISGRLAFFGSIAVVIGAFTAALASLMVKMLGGKVHPVTITFGQMLFGIVPLAIVGFTLEGNPLNFNWTGTAIFSTIYLAVFGSVLAFWMFYWLIDNIEISKAMLISLVTPLIAIVIGAIFLNEELPRYTIAGGALILFSVGLVLFKPKAKVADKDDLDVEIGLNA